MGKLGRGRSTGVFSPGPGAGEQKKRAAYALYLAKAAQAYIEAGLHFEHLAIQNEPNQGGGSAWPA